MSAPTPQQQAAIAARGNVLVAAGAGTGKTSTVTERCLQLVLAEGCRLDQILMVTFTEAAAAEMRERIRQELREHADAAPLESETARRLAEELALLDAAPVSTLHSFCLDLVRRNFHALGLDPQFTVLDEPQTKPLVHAVLDEIFLRYYAGPDARSSSVRELVRGYGNGRDEAIRKLVINIHQHAQTLPRPEQWLEQQMAAYRDPSPAAWKKIFVTGVQDWALFWRDVLVAMAGGSPNVTACLQALSELPAEDVTFEPAASALEKIVAADTADWPRGTKTKVRKPIEAFFKEAEFLLESTRADAAPLAQDWNWAREPMLALLLLAREFTAEFSSAKRELGGIDFADQEQLALRLLYDDAGRFTPVALACRERFRFVFVDECQDINAAQDAILRAVSGEREQANRFLVGDVKQSIYRFRLADPRIFQNYEERWNVAADVRRRTQTATNSLPPGGGDAAGRVLPLTENFRSRAALLNFINPLFRTLMRPVIGGLHYDANAELRFGNPDGRKELSLSATIPAEEITPRVELHVIEKNREAAGGVDAEDEGGGASELAELQTTEREARLVALRLKQLKVSGHRIWNTKRHQFEAVEYRDMVVLMRSVAGRAEIFAKVFHQAGVPLTAERAGFLNALEVTDLLNLLRLLDNPLQDVPLLAVLRSPLVGLSTAELAQVRMTDRNNLFWFALTKCRASGAKGQEKLTAKVTNFLDQFTRWRELIRHSSLTHCLETALAETHYEALLLAGERGAARMANVRRLVELARRFDPYQREGLFRFLRFIAEQEDAEVRHEPAALDHENAVRLMTIHASKGLEFPVVALAGLGGRFNLRDLGNDILLNADLGLCPKILPPESRRRYPSITHWVATQRERRALLGEEMRLLYVALTRARDTLVLVGSGSKKDEAARWRGGEPVSDFALVKASGELDWLRLWFTQAVKSEAWSDENSGANDLLRWKFYNPNDVSLQLLGKNMGGSEEPLPLPTAGELESLKKLAGWQYPNGAATFEPAKVSVSALRRRAAEADEDAAQGFQFLKPARRAMVRSENSGKLSAAEIGTAHHTFMQFVALNRTASELDLRNEAARLQAGGALAPDEVAALDFAALMDFWQSKTGQRLRATPEKSVNREMPFTARMSATDLRSLGLPLANPDLADGEFVVVQGIVDLAVLLPEEIWLLDFKTDDVMVADLAVKTKLYAPQLKLYALALQRIYGRPVTECWLHFLTARNTVSLKCQSKA